MIALAATLALAFLLTLALLVIQRAGYDLELERRKAAEAACDAAVSEVAGVLVTRDARTGMLITANESIAVPYGKIYTILQYPGGDIE